MLPVALLTFPLDLLMPVLTRSSPDLSSMPFPHARGVGSCGSGCLGGEKVSGHTTAELGVDIVGLL